MLKIWLIRHGQTEGNKLGRYIGVTDEPLSPEGAEHLRRLCYPSVEAVFISPLLRCVQTAEILFPDKEPHRIKELAECDFGEFENKNYKELAGNANYQAWIDSDGRLPFPKGESREDCRSRNLMGFGEAVDLCIRQGISSAAFVIHGGTIMNLMEAYCDVKRTFYEWHVANGCGFAVEIDQALWEKGQRILYLKESVDEEQKVAYLKQKLDAPVTEEDLEKIVSSIYGLFKNVEGSV